MRIPLSVVTLCILMGCSEQVGAVSAESEILPVDVTRVDATGCPDPRIIDAPRDVTEFIATAADFSCFLPSAQPATSVETRWYPVRRFYLRNLLGRTQEALDVACGRRSGPYPQGTILQLIYFEVMSKRGGNYSPEANGWEFMALDVEDTQATIGTRGATETVNFAGGNCFQCHSQAKPQWDLVCENSHGCDPLGIDGDTLKQLQEGDPRCK